jgi:hypothetical protein
LSPLGQPAAPFRWGYPWRMAMAGGGSDGFQYFSTGARLFPVASAPPDPSRPSHRSGPCPSRPIRQARRLILATAPPPNYELRLMDVGLAIVGGARTGHTLPYREN